MNWEFGAGARWFPYVDSVGNVFSNSARVMTAGKRTFSDVQDAKCVRFLSEAFKPVHRKTSVEAADAVSPVKYASAYFPSPAFNAFFMKDEIVEEEAPQDLKEMMSKNDCKPSSWQHIQNFVEPMVCLFCPMSGLSKR